MHLIWEIKKERKNFNDNGSQNYLIFQPDFKYFQLFSGLSEKSIATSAKSDNSFPAKLIHIHNSKVAVKFHGNCVKQDKVSFTHGNAVNAFIVYELNVLWSWGLHFDFTLKHRLFGALKLTKNADPDKYYYSGYVLGFDVWALS